MKNNSLEKEAMQELDSALEELTKVETTINNSLKTKIVFPELKNKITLKEKWLLSTSSLKIAWKAQKQDRSIKLFSIIVSVTVSLAFFGGVFMAVNIFASNAFSINAKIMNYYFSTPQMQKTAFFINTGMLLIEYLTIFTVVYLRMLCYSAMIGLKIPNWREKHHQAVWLVEKHLYSLPAYHVTNRRLKRLIYENLRKKINEDTYQTILCLATDSTLSIEEVLQMAKKIN